MKHILMLLGTAVLAISGCKKDDLSAFDSTLTGELSIEFDNIVGSSDLQLNTATYTNALNENFKVTKFKYYVSNVVLTNIDGSEYTVAQDSSYFLIDESEVSSRRAILKVPEGEYKTLTFMLGVDSLRNTRDISQRTGVLDPSLRGADMYWGWNSGYIFFKMEGTSPAITDMGNVFMYHIGGFGGYSAPTPNNLKTITIDLSSGGTPKVKVNKPANVHLMVDVSKAINGNTNISFANTPFVHSPGNGGAIADNYQQMFRHDHTEN